jgi:hypothetical protein
MVSSFLAGVVEELEAAFCGGRAPLAKKECEFPDNFSESSGDLFFRFFLSEKLSYVPAPAWLFSATGRQQSVHDTGRRRPHHPTLLTRKKE